MLLGMPKDDAFFAFTDSFKHQRSIADPVAEDTWTFKDLKGRKRTIVVAVGKPRPIADDPKEDWCCPIFIGGWTPHVRPIFGIGPIDSLMNAVGVVKAFYEMIGHEHAALVMARGRKQPRSARRSARVKRPR